MAKANVDVSNTSSQKISSNDSQIIDHTIQTKLSDQFPPYYLISRI